MGGTTIKWAFPYPALTDAANVPQWLEDLADALDLIVTTYATGIASARPAGKAGQWYRATDTGVISFFDTAWRDVNVITAGSITYTMLAAGVKPSGGAADGTEALRALGVSAGQAASGVSFQAHLDDTVDAHDATAISYNGSANLSSNNVEGALDELDTEKAAQGDMTAVQSDVSVIKGAWTAFSPTLLGAGGNPSFGTGGTGGRYLKIGRTVHFKAIWRWIGGSSGSGVYTVSVPQGTQIDMTVGTVGLASIGFGHIVLNDNSLVNLSVVAKDGDEFFLKYNAFGVETNLAAPASVPVYLTISGTYEATS